jgi:DnaJ-class molecular chaperone
MKRSIIYFGLILISSASLICQVNIWDTLVKKDGTSIQGSVQRFVNDSVEFKPKGKRTIIIKFATADLSMIVYSDGKVFTFQNSNENTDDSKTQGTKTIDVQSEPVAREEICINCKGTGMVTIQCPKCNGTGRLPCPNHQPTLIRVCPTCGGSLIDPPGTIPCPDCDGKGNQFVTCSACGGKGRITLNK